MYASPAWGSVTSEQQRQRVIQIERKAMKIVNPNISYDEAIKLYQTRPAISHIDHISRQLIANMHNNTDHPLNDFTAKSQAD